MTDLDNSLEAARTVCGDDIWQPVADHLEDLGNRIADSMTDTRTTIRGLDPELYQWLRIEAVRQRTTIGALINEILRRAKATPYLLDSLAVTRHDPSPERSER